jgi:TRAP-type C4-dicarboxylate transport system permease small subunit
MRAVSWFDSLSRLLGRTCLRFAVIAMVALVVDVLYGVAARSIMERPPVWTEEFARYLFIWVTFLGSTAIYQSSEHIVVDLVIKAFPGWSVKYLIMLIHVIVAAVAVAMVISGVNIVERTMVQRTSVMQIPFGLVYAVIPLSGLLFLLHAVNGIMDASKGEKSISDISIAVGEL